ncbi:MAG TPA: lasso peptide biosynthesis B2 protein [Vicinamibacterales bacterium]|jgi:hypothetical protein
MSVWRDRLRRWTWADYATLCEVFVAALVVEIALRMVSLLTIDRAIGWAFRSRCVADPTALDVDRLARFAAAPYRLFRRSGTCLRESIVLSVLLRRRGVSAFVRFGVRLEEGLTAHAWVDIPGVRSEAGSPFHELRGAWID